MLLDFT